MSALQPPFRAILLVDMDAFFASVEQAHHPHLRGKPVIVCGDPDRRGVVTAASYEARPFGVRAGMPLAEARRLCPQAEYVEGSPQKYVGLSLQLLDLYLAFSPDVEPFSVDEAFVGLGPECPDLGAAREVAATIQRQVRERFELSCSIGIGPNKLVAKMASGVSKPSGLTALDEAAFRETFWPREVQEMWGIGPKLAERMHGLGIRTIGDLARAPEPSLRAAFGIIGPQLREAAHGHDQTPLVPYHRGLDAKSVGHELTLPEDCDEAPALEGILLRLADQVARRMRGEGYVGRTVTLKLRDHRFHTVSRQRALRGHTADGPVIFEVARRLLHENWRGGPVRLLGISVSSLGKGEDDVQGSLFAPDARSHLLREALDRVRDKLGEASVVPLASMRHRRSLGHVSFGAGKPAGPSSAASKPSPGKRQERPEDGRRATRGNPEP